MWITEYSHKSNLRKLRKWEMLPLAKFELGDNGRANIDVNVILFLFSKYYFHWAAAHSHYPILSSPPPFFLSPSAFSSPPFPVPPEPFFFFFFPFFSPLSSFMTFFAPSIPCLLPSSA